MPSSASQVLAFRDKAPTPLDEGEQSSLRVLYTQNREAAAAPRKYSRHIPQAPERILDAPELLDDYYLNLLDWSPNNVLGVALGDAIYLWNANDGSIQQLMQTTGEQTHVTSLCWCPEGTYMAVGTSDHKVQLWDVDKLRQVRSMTGHRARVSSLSWNGPCLSSGGRDSIVLHHDVRVASTRWAACAATPRRCAASAGRRAARSSRAAATTTSSTCGTTGAPRRASHRR